MAVPIFIKEITPLSIGFEDAKLETIAALNKEPRKIIRIYGILLRCRIPRNRKRDNPKPFRFSGYFQAVNLLTKKEYRAKRMCMGMLDEALIQAMSLHDEAGFGIDISVEKESDSRSKKKYRWAISVLKIGDVNLS